MLLHAILAALPLFELTGDMRLAKKWENIFYHLTPGLTLHSAYSPHSPPFSPQTPSSSGQPSRPSNTNPTRSPQKETSPAGQRPSDAPNRHLSTAPRTFYDHSSLVQRATFARLLRVDCDRPAHTVVEDVNNSNVPRPGWMRRQAQRNSRSRSPETRRTQDGDRETNAGDHHRPHVLKRNALIVMRIDN
jgi:hypothetical protein